MRRLGKVHRLVEDQTIAGEPAAAALRAGTEPDPLTALQLDAFLAMRTRDPSDPPVEFRGLLDQAEKTPERLKGRVELVGRMDNEPFTQEEQAREFAALKNRAFPILARHDKTDLERGPFPVFSFTERVAEDELLPRVEDQASHLREFDRLGTGRTDRRGDRADPR